jgi:prepilin-type N-terminal cleavage/methylation domain-containing protein
LKNRSGFTIVEIVVAIVILSVGLLGLVTTAALVSRMIAQGQRYSMATTLANRRFEMLAAKHCNALGSGGNDTVGRITMTWTVTNVNSAGGRRIVMTVNSPTGRGTHTDKFTNYMACL